jgi:2-octaprenyl-6-methoxyphenol hydroxylase
VSAVDQSCYDVSVVGAGLNGLVCALAAAQYGFRVALIERQALVPPGIDCRHLALSQASIDFLLALGLVCLKQHSRSFAEVLFTAKGHTAWMHFHAKPNVPLGGGIGAQALLTELRQLVQGHARIDVYENMQLQVLEQAVAQVKLKLCADSGHILELASRFVVGADGSRSSVRHLLGFTWQQLPCAMQALLFEVTGYDQSSASAHLRAVDGLFVAYVPHCVRGRGTIIVTGDKAPIERLVCSSAMEQQIYLQQAFAYRLGLFSACRVLGDPWPLSLGYAPDLVKHRVALIGQASLAAPPIAALGFNLGVCDSMVLLQGLLKRCAADLVVDAPLQFYHDQQYLAHHRVWHVCRLLPRVWQDRGLLLRLLRSFGLLGAALMPKTVQTYLHVT